jgi:PrcB C-terminal
MKLAGLAAIAAVAAGWLLYVHAWRDSQPRALAYRDLTARLHVQPNASFARRFRERTEIDDYVSRNGAPPAPRIDFARDEAVLVSAGPRSSTGYRVEVASAARERGRIVLTVRERTPSLADPGQPRVTYPYRLLVFRRTDVPVYVHWLNRP